MQKVINLPSAGDAASGAASSSVSPALLITADDRTGALETGGACADLGFAVRLAAAPDADDDCAVVDLDSRHCAAEEAARRIRSAHGQEARFRCHKMDSGLRGNWAHEVAALVATGRRVGLLASFPDAGRRCHDGTVFIRDVPVADSPFGRDPRNRLLSSRPADYLIAAGCGSALANGDLVVLDANDNDELHDAARRCRDEGRLLAGTTGGIGAYVATLRPAKARPPLPPLPRPALIVCGSLHPLSRAQIAALQCLTAAPDQSEAACAALAGGADVVLATEMAAAIEDAAAEAMATKLATVAWRWLAESGAPTLIVLGGDSAAAILGNRTLHVLGSMDTAVPASVPENGEPTIVTKGGGIGEPDTLARLLGPAGSL